ncbi:creatinase/Prolidase N-terminal domain protein, partial [Vibrio parahaemolyticus V-223/04]
LSSNETARRRSSINKSCQPR